MGSQGLGGMIQTRQSCEFVIYIESDIKERVEAGEAMTVENMEKGREEIWTQQ